MSPSSIRIVLIRPTHGGNIGASARAMKTMELDSLWVVAPETGIGEEAQAMGRPVLIFSGGEPLARKDLFELAAYAHALGLPIALSTNGTLVDAPTARRLKEAGIYYASVSFDGAKARTHDFFRGAGNYERALAGFGSLRDAQIKVQINFTVTRLNVPEVQEIYEMARSQRAIALYLFLLVPVGCGEQIAADQMLGAAEVERWLEWVAEKDREGPLPIKAICAPQFYRVAEPETGRNGGDAWRGCTCASFHTRATCFPAAIFRAPRATSEGSPCKRSGTTPRSSSPCGRRTF